MLNAKGFTFDEIADMQLRESGAIRTGVSRLKKKIRTLFGEQPE